MVAEGSMGFHVCILSQEKGGLRWAGSTSADRCLPVELGKQGEETGSASHFSLILRTPISLCREGIPPPAFVRCCSPVPPCRESGRTQPPAASSFGRAGVPDTKLQLPPGRQV